MSDPSRGSPEPSDEAPIIDPFALRPGAGTSLRNDDAEAPVLDPFLAGRPPPQKKKVRRGFFTFGWPIIVMPFLGVLAVGTYFLYPRLYPLPHVSSHQPAPFDPNVAADPTAPPLPDPTLIVPAPVPVAPSGSARDPRSGVPKKTIATQVGRIPVVDVGTEDDHTLEEILREQRAAALADHRVLLAMTVRYAAPEFRDLDAALSDPRMQEALDNVKLVRVDARYFEKELDALGIPTRYVPGLWLLGADLVPRDGIDGGEWDDDIPANIAPVVSAFVRGTYKHRRRPWTPPPGRGVQL